MNQARCNWCVPIVLLSIWCNVCACHGAVYHYIAATVVYLVPRIIPMYCCLSGHSPIYHYIIFTVVYCVLHHSCVCLGYVIIELVSPKDEVCWKSKNTCLKSGLIRNTYTRYHVCLMRVLIILLSIRYDVCACHCPVYHYITATAVYLIQRFITACVVLCDHIVCISLG